MKQIMLLCVNFSKNVCLDRWSRDWIKVSCPIVFFSDLKTGMTRPIFKHFGKKLPSMMLTLSSSEMTSVWIFLLFKH